METRCSFLTAEKMTLQSENKNKLDQIHQIRNVMKKQ